MPVPAGARGREGLPVYPSKAKGQWVRPEAAEGVAGIRPPFGTGDEMLVPTGGKREARESGRARKQT